MSQGAKASLVGVGQIAKENFEGTAKAVCAHIQFTVFSSYFLTRCQDIPWSSHMPSCRLYSTWQATSFSHTTSNLTQLFASELGGFT